MLDVSFQLWSSGDGFIENLKLLLGLSDFPTAPAVTEYSQDLVHQGECAICFMARLEGELPSRACDNEKCGMTFHVACLFEVCFYNLSKQTCNVHVNQVVWAYLVTVFT
jgi:FANCL C-terminal domain.